MTSNTNDSTAKKCNDKEKELLYLCTDMGLHRRVGDPHGRIKQLLSEGVSPDIENEKGETPLHLCVRLRDTEIIECILNQSVNLDIESSEGFTPLFMLFYHDIDFQGTGIRLSAPRYGDRPEKRIKEIIELLVEKGADINKMHRKTGKTLLHYLAKDKNNLESIQYLVEKGAECRNFSSLSYNMQSLFKEALLEKLFAAAKFFLEHGAAIHDNDWNLVTEHIRDSDDVEILNFLLDNGGDIEKPHDKDKTTTALTMTLINKKDNIYKCIMKRNPNIDLTLEYLLKNDLYFYKNDFKLYLKKLLEKMKDMKEQEKISLLMKWSSLNQRVDADKIEKCIDILDILEIPITNKEKIDNVKKNLTNSLHPIKHTTFKDILRKYIEFPKHDPKRLTEILKKFSSSENLKYTNHPWDGDGLTYEKFIKDALTGFDEIKNDLKELAPTLYEKLNEYIFSEENKNKWLDDDSRGEIQKEIKHLIVIKNDDNDLTLSEIFMNIQDTYQGKIESKDLSISLEGNIGSPPFDKIFLNRGGLSSALSIIFKDIVVRKDDNNKKINVTCIEDDATLIVIKITYEGATSSKSAEELKETIVNNGGNFAIIKDNLTSVCDWSIETVCKDGKGYHIEYLHNDGDDATLTCSSEKPIGFTHILRFYR